MKAGAASKPRLRGRKIVRVEWREFDAGRRMGDGSRKISTDPVFHLDDGSRITFSVEETEVGEYGISVNLHPPVKQSEPEKVDPVNPGPCKACQLIEAGMTKIAEGMAHTPTEPNPTMEQIQEWVFDSVCDATDGCQVEPDGRCQHGHKSWLLVLGLV